MGSDPPMGLTPYEKTQNSGEIKSSGTLYNKADEPAEEIRKILPSPDKVELSGKIEFTESMMTYHLTGNKNLNEYIMMVNQAAQFHSEKAAPAAMNENSQSFLQTEYKRLHNPGCDIRA